MSVHPPPRGGRECRLGLSQSAPGSPAEVSQHEGGKSSVALQATPPVFTRSYALSPFSERVTASSAEKTTFPAAAPQAFRSFVHIYPPNIMRRPWWDWQSAGWVDRFRNWSLEQVVWKCWAKEFCKRSSAWRSRKPLGNDGLLCLGILRLNLAATAYSCSHSIEKPPETLNRKTKSRQVRKPHPEPWNRNPCTDMLLASVPWGPALGGAAGRSNPASSASAPSWASGALVFDFLAAACEALRMIKTRVCPECTLEKTLSPDFTPP